MHHITIWMVQILRYPPVAGYLIENLPCSFCVEFQVQRAICTSMAVMCVCALQVIVYLNTMHFWSKYEWKSCIFFIPHLAVEFISALQLPHKTMFQVPRPLSDTDFQNAYSMIEQHVFITLGGLSDPGYSRWSSLFQRCISFMTIGLLKSTNWNPVTLAPPCMNLSKDMSLKPWVDQKHNRNKDVFGTM